MEACACMWTDQNSGSSAATSSNPPEKSVNQSEHYRGKNDALTALEQEGKRLQGCILLSNGNRVEHLLTGNIHAPLLAFLVNIGVDALQVCIQQCKIEKRCAQGVPEPKQGASHLAAGSRAGTMTRIGFE